MKNFLTLMLLVFSAQPRASVTVSGISSGGYFANQFHVANSSWVSGAGIVAGGPYFCAKGELVQALNRCMNVFLGVPQSTESLAHARNQAQLGKIDDLENLAGSRAYVIFGKLDKTVDPKVGQSLVEFYRKAGLTSEAIRVDADLLVGHAWPTLSFGNPCKEASKSPFLSKCQRDVSGELLAHLLGPLKPKAQARDSHLFSFPQGNARELAAISLASTAYAYVPARCQGALGECPLHVAFHGCKQTIKDIGLTFVTKTGLNDHAEANDIVILYPQTESSQQLGNPNGCWDWWGYAGKDYATRDGLQMKSVSQLIKRFQAGDVELTPAL